MKWYEVKEKDHVETIQKNRKDHGFPTLGRQNDMFAMPAITEEFQQVFTDGKDECFLVEEDKLAPEEKAKLENVKPVKFDKVKGPKEEKVK